MRISSCRLGRLLKVSQLRTSLYSLARQLAAFPRRRPFHYGLQAISFVVVMTALGGCILASDRPDLALNVPATYGARGTIQNGAPPTLDWWRGFHSAELTTLIEEAATANLDIASAASRILEANAQARMAGSSLLPLVTASASDTRSRFSGAIPFGGGYVWPDTTTYQAYLSASYEIDFWGKNREATLAAEENANARGFDRDVVTLTTLTSVANAYFQVLAAQDRIRIANNNIANAKRIYEAIQQRMIAGTVTSLELAQQESVLDNQRATLPMLRQTLAQNINTLATLLSRPPEMIAVQGGSLTRIASPRVLPGLPSELLLQRPDIREAEALLAAATANVGSARAQFFPSIQLTGQGGVQSAALKALFNPEAAFFTLVAGVTQPIFDGFHIQGNFDYYKARQDELLQTYRKAVVSAFADVDNALVATSQSAEKVRLLTKVERSSRRAFDLAEQLLNSGATDVVTVFNTQLTLFQAEDSLAQARLDHLLAAVSLFKALGGGWAPKDR